MTPERKHEDREETRGRPVRVIPLGTESPEDEVLGDLSPGRRLELVDELSARMWELTGRPAPSYTRSKMPVRVVRRE